MLQTDKQTDKPSKIGVEDKPSKTDRRNPQGVPTVVQKRHITNTESKPTSFVVASPTEGPIQPTLVQKTSRHQHGVPTDLLDV